MTSVKGYLAILSALVFCPCHLLILAAVLAGTSLGSLISEHYGLLFPLTALYFIGALFVGVRWMTRSEGEACGTCVDSAVALEQREKPGDALASGERANGRGLRGPAGRRLGR